MLEAVRGISGRRYQPDGKLWELPCRGEDVQGAMEAAGYHVTADTEMGRPLEAPSQPRRIRADRIAIRTLEGERAVVGGRFRAMLAAVKAIEGRRWLPRDRVWELPGTLVELGESLAGQGFRIVTQEEAEGLPPAPPGEVSDAALSEAPAPSRRRDQILLRTQDGKCYLVGGSFEAMLGAVRDVDGRRFVSAEKLWELPCTMAVVRDIMAARGYAIEPVEAPAAAPEAELPPDMPFTEPPPEELEEEESIF